MVETDGFILSCAPQPPDMKPKSWGEETSWAGCWPDYAPGDNTSSPIAIQFKPGSCTPKKMPIQRHMRMPCKYSQKMSVFPYSVSWARLTLCLPAYRHLQQGTCNPSSGVPWVTTKKPSLLDPKLCLCAQSMGIRLMDVGFQWSTHSVCKRKVQTINGQTTWGLIKIPSLWFHLS